VGRFAVKVQAELEVSISRTTNERKLKAQLKEKGMKGTMSFPPDHNVCDKCKEDEDIMREIYVLLKILSARKCSSQLKDLALKEVERLIELVTAIQDKAQQQAKEHLKKDTDTCGFMHEFINHVKKGRVQKHILWVHVDEKSAFNDPFCPRAACATLHAFQRPLTGFADMINDTFTAILTELGICNKDSVKLATEILMYVIGTVTTQRIIILLLDCGPINHCNAICHLLVKFLVDIGLCNHCEIILFEQKHGKGKADGDFGNISVVLEKHATLGIDSAGRHIKTVTTHRAKNTKCEAFIGMPDSYVDLAQFFNRYGTHICVYSLHVHICVFRFCDCLFCLATTCACM
jgi:hypothetical protein